MANGWASCNRARDFSLEGWVKRTSMRWKSGLASLSPRSAASVSQRRISLMQAIARFVFMVFARYQSGRVKVRATSGRGGRGHLGPALMAPRVVLEPFRLRKSQNGTMMQTCASSLYQR